MATAPTPVPDSGAVPDYNDRATFGTRVLAWDNWTKSTMVPGVNAIAQNAYANALDAAAQAAAAASASQSAATAASAAGAPLWVSGTTYAVGNLTRSVTNGRVYQRRVAGAGTTDPASDTTNWALYTFSLTVVEVTSNMSATVGNHYIMTGNYTLTMPATGLVQGDRIRVTNASGLTTPSVDFGAVKVRGTVYGVITMGSPTISFEVQYDNSTYGWN